MHPGNTAPKGCAPCANVAAPTVGVLRWRVAEACEEARASVQCSVPEELGAAFGWCAPCNTAVAHERPQASAGGEQGIPHTGRAQRASGCGSEGPRLWLSPRRAAARCAVHATQLARASMPAGCGAARPTLSRARTATRRASMGCQTSRRNFVAKKAKLLQLSPTHRGALLQYCTVCVLRKLPKR